MQNQQRSNPWLQARPRLRTDLCFQPQRFNRRTVFVVEDPLRTKFFRLGRPEYLLVAALDGKTTLEDAVSFANQELEEAELTADDALAILNWAAQNDLLESEPGQASSERTEQPVGSNLSQTPSWNPICFRISLGRMEPWIAKVYPFFAWIFSPWMTIAGIMLIGVGLAALIENWERLVASKDQIFSPTGQLSLLVCWIVLKVIHEFSHGLACRRYGAAVGEAGVMLILFLPIAYVNVTSAWKIRSRWQRIHIAAAGMQVELYVAAAAALAWSFTAPGIFNQFCANLALMAGLTTLLFNANPLMRFDGYYILTDLLEMPNLAVTGQHWLRGWANQFFFGITPSRANLPEGRTTLTRVYAVSAFIWRIVVCVGLMVAAAAMWHGAGLILAVIAAAAWFGQPLCRLLRWLWEPSGPAAPDRRRFANVVAAISVGTTLGLLYLPWPGVRKVSGIVDYEPLTVIRSVADGTVDHLFVRSGEAVEQGQELAVLRNDELVRDFEIQRLKTEASRLQIRGFRGRRELAALAAEIEQLAALEIQLRELEEQVKGLTIRAPVAGRVVSRDLQSRLGSYLHEGDELLSLGSEEQKRISISLPQKLVSALETGRYPAVRISIDGESSFADQLDRLEPRATVHPIEQALCTPFGGDLLVRATPASNSTTDVEVTYELLEPHFTGCILLDQDRSARLRSGQRAQVALSDSRAKLGPHLWEMLLDWLTESRASGAT